MNFGVDRVHGIVAAIGDGALPLRTAAARGLLDAIDPKASGANTLNPILELGRAAWTALLEQLRAIAGDVEDLLVPVDSLALQLPIDVGDYVDFYASIHHATNLGELLRPGTEPLLPNWRHLPVSYHGRAGTVVVSGTSVRRPRGLVMTDDGPTYQPTARLDIELEVGVVIGGRSTLGEPVAIDDAGEHIFGVVLLNDWSARDIQAYEYQPLGPHLGKSFATSISAWVTPIDDLRPFLVPGPPQEPPPSPHLTTTQPWGIDLELGVQLNDVQITTTNFSTMYWTVAQMLAHLTANGASIRPGDLYGSGTVSGPERGSEGSLIEITRGGDRPLSLPDGSTRTFLEDGDRVRLDGRAGDIRLGSVEGEILPAR